MQSSPSRAGKVNATPQIQLVTAAVFLCTCVVLYVLRAHHFVPSLDEGIFLDGARRILAGQAPYRDFFILMGPGSFWLQAGIFKLFGVTLSAAHTLPILDVAALAACVCWLVASRTTVRFAVWISAVFVILETADTGLNLPNHRWDSAAFAMLALTIAASSDRRRYLFLAGMCGAFAAWITPTVGLASLAIVAFLWVRERARCWPFLAGNGVISLVCAGVLAAQGALEPMLRQMLWTGSNYSGANFLFYGSRLGGYGQFFAEAHGAAILGFAVLALGFTLPALLPPVAISWLWSTRQQTADSRSFSMQLLLVGGIALVVATYPRMDARHLTYAAPAFYALCAILLAELPRRTLRSLVTGGISALAILFGLYGIAANYAGQTTVTTAVGNLRASSEDAAFVQAVTQAIPKGTRSFVFPYFPIAYFVTLSQNPTRFSYLQPGMMNAEDESAALTALRNSPPERVLYYDLPDKEILRIWPSSDPARLHLSTIESYLAANYQTIGRLSNNLGNFRILSRNPALNASAPVQSESLAGTK
ncbi:MAG: hypothetical protein ABI824_07635 [Acidobacteriota bacterium]